MFVSHVNHLCHVLLRRAFVTDVRSRTDTIIANQARQPTAQVQSVGYDMTSLVNEMRDGLNTVKRDVAAASAKLGNAPPGGSAGGTCPNCLTTTMFFMFGAVQLVLLFGYFMYR